MKLLRNPLVVGILALIGICLMVVGLLIFMATMGSFAYSTRHW